MADSFDTQLTPEEEAQFQQWAEATGRSNDTLDYDLRGAWKAGIRPNQRGHLPDTYKKPNHPTFSSESQYSNPDMSGGEWVPGATKDSWVFQASPYNMSQHSIQDLEDYFRRVEPGSQVIFPDATSRLKAMGY